MTDFRRKLLQIQKQIYKKELRLIRESLAPDRRIARYAREYRQYLQSYESIYTLDEFLKKILGCDIVFHGDYHPLRQSQRSVLRILREIAPKRRVILFLEMFHRDHQEHLDRFLAGEIQEATFLRRIAYDRTWGFPWENWKPVIDLCRDSGIRIFGINTVSADKNQSMYRRDTAAASLIVRRIMALSNNMSFMDRLDAEVPAVNTLPLAYVIDGDYHVSPNHLPAQVQRRCSSLGVTLNRVIVYQNDENLYWKLAEEHLEEHEILRISEDSFCIMSTTPVNKLQSYLNWLEYSKEAYYPSQFTWEESPEQIGGASIYELVKTICMLLRFPFPSEALDRLTVYYGSNLDFLQMIHAGEHFAPLRSVITSKIRANEGFLIEYEDQDRTNYCIYLPNSSLNMAAEEAAHFVNVCMRGARNAGMNGFDLFYHSVITEALGFFGSKLINEKRKPVSPRILRAYLKTKKSGLLSQWKNRETCNALLGHIKLEKRARDMRDFRKAFPRLYSSRSTMFSAVSTQLGYILGNKLYYGVKNGAVTISFVQDLFRERFEKERGAFDTYIRLSNMLRKIKGTGPSRSIPAHLQLFIR